MSKTKPELGVKVGYASIDEASPDAVLHLTGGATADGMQQALRTIREDLDFVTSVSCTVTEADVYLSVRATEQYNNRRGYSYFDDDRRGKLIELVQPKCTRKVTVTATAKRPDKYKHTGTLVVFTLSEGDDFAKVTVGDLSQVDGVTRARKAGNSIVFSMATPAANDDEGKITQVVDAVAKQLNAMVVRPIEVKDDNADAALDPANDYVSKAASTPESGNEG
jgi:hypothetical protein